MGKPSKGGREGSGVPYCINRAEWWKRRRGHSDSSKDKPKSIVEQTLKEEQTRIRAANATYQKLLSEGKVTKRKADGSYYVLGGTP